MRNIAVTVSLVAVMGVMYLKFSQVIVEDQCTGTQSSNPKQWLFIIFHNVSKGYFTYQIFSLLWKSLLLEGSSGSRRFVSTVLKLLIIMAVQSWQLWGANDTYPSICYDHLWRIISGMYGFLLHAYQTQNPLVIGASFTAELAFVYFSYHVIPLFNPVCGTLAGLLCSYAPPVLISCWNRAWSCVACLFQIIVVQKSLDKDVLVWKCRSCTSENGVFLHVCDSCGESRGVVDYDNSVMDDLQRALISENSDRTGLVWTCMTCTYENGVFLQVCDNCGTSHDAVPYDDSTMDNPPRYLISENSDRTSLLWNCLSCTFENGVYVLACEICRTPRPISD